MSLLFIRPIQPICRGEKLLLASIFRRAAYDIALYKGEERLARRKLWKDAYDWLMNETDEHFTSFNSICLLLNQDPKELRRKALLLQRKDVRKYDMVDAHGGV